jgi:hypothetical protein
MMNRFSTIFDFCERTALPAAVVRGALVLLVFVVIWIPWFAYNHVPETLIAPAAIEEARYTPDDRLLEELTSYDVGASLFWQDDRQLVNAAEKLLQGQADIPGFNAGSLELPLTAATMAAGPTMWQLKLHSLILPRVLLEAYKAEGRPEFLRAAADYLLAYDDYEGSGWQPGGFLWNDKWSRFVRNDHAISARVFVLAEFWRLYRHSGEYRPDAAEAVFRMVARCAYLLTDPSRFTFATNHGIMQNLAVCHLSLSFPTLPSVDNYCRLAFERLDEQLSFFINDEGFVLEHSPGYQGLALMLIGLASRYRTLLGLEIPQHWLRKYEAAQRVYAELRRPDGSLPVFGDTDGGSDGEGPLVAPIDDHGLAWQLENRDWSPSKELMLAPGAGYCLWWDGLDAWPESPGLSQTVVAWSHFPGMGHKHADEMSLGFWADGTSWWTNVGYWAYDAPGRDIAESWEGSNAPHLVGEPAQSQRETHLRFHGREGELAVIDLERRGPGTYRALRQIIRVGPRIWIAIDASTADGGGRTQVAWTTSPDVQLAKSSVNGEYNLTDKSSGHSLRAFFRGAPGTEWRTIEGSLSPFGGWTVVGQVTRPAPAVIVERPADGSWLLAAWSLDAEFGPGLTAAPRMRRWAGAEDWDALLPTSIGSLTLQRREALVEVSAGPSGPTWSLMLKPGPEVSQATADFRSAFAVAAEKYGVADMSGVYRVKVTVVLVVVLLLNAILTRAVQRYRVARGAFLGCVLMGGWLLLSCYFVFLRANLV